MGEMAFCAISTYPIVSFTLEIFYPHPFPLGSLCGILIGAGKDLNKNGITHIYKTGYV
jgi:hypothetical protein